VYGNVEIAAAAGEVNTLSLQYVSGRSGANDALLVTDSTTAPLPGDRCTQIDTDTVRCSHRRVPSIAQVDATLGDMNDSATARGLSDTLFVKAGAGDDQLSGAGIDMEGGTGNDVLTGARDRESMDGGAGDDTLTGKRDIDYLDGGPGDDTILAGTGHDVLLGGGVIDDPAPAGSDTLDGGPGNDSLDDQDALGESTEVGSDTLIGGPGFDYVHSYILRPDPVRVDLTQPTGNGEEGENDRLEEVEWIDGGSADDTLIGDDRANGFDGARGRDRIDGRGGPDLIVSDIDPDDDADDAPRFGPDDISGGDGADLIETLGALQSRVACDEGDDKVRLAGYSSDRPAPARGPLVSQTCERLAMSDSGPRRRVGVDPSPARTSADSIFLRLLKLGSAEHAVKVARDDERLATAPARRPTVRLRVGEPILREAAQSPVTLTGTITNVATNPFVWRFQIGDGAF
jgi:Ca2+-binding RTX toxin-like protein